MTSPVAGVDVHGFPLYGTPLSVAAGQWLVRGEDLPIESPQRPNPQTGARKLAFLRSEGPAVAAIPLSFSRSTLP